jgi:toxin FitB
MSGYLLDTNCISEIVRIRPEPRVAAWIDATDESLPYLSVLTLGEIRKGLAALSQEKRRTQLEAWLDVHLRGRSSGKILSVDSRCRSVGLARRDGRIRSRASDRLSNSVPTPPALDANNRLA